MVDEGYIRACSVGFIPTEWEFSEDRRGGIDFKRQTLLELSLCPVGANGNALIEAKGWGRGAALSERPTPALSVMSFAGDARERRWQLAHHLRQAIKRG
jgi:hypothetical protein